MDRRTAWCPRAVEIERLEERLVLSTTYPLAADHWTALGPAPITNGSPGGAPVSGRITGIAADATDPNKIYVAAAGGGAWKTLDGGTTWQPLTDNVTDGSGKPVPLFSGAIAVDPQNSQIVYVGTGEANNSGDSFYGRGILKSTTGGTSWTLIDNGGAFDRKTIAKIVVNPAVGKDNIVFALVNDLAVNGSLGSTGTWKSIDFGATWTNVTPSLGNFDEPSDIVIDPNNSNNVYMAVGSSFGSSANGVYRSTTGGASGSFSLLAGLPTGASDSKIGRIALALSKDGVDLYVSIPDAGNGQLYKMYQVVNPSAGSPTVNDQTSTTPNYLGANGYGQGWYDTTLAVDPANSQVVYAGGSDNGGSKGMVETRDGGLTWSPITSDGTIGPHTDHHATAFDANGKFLDGNDGGIFRLKNPLPASLAWDDLNGNLGTIQFTGIALDPTDPNIAYGGSQDNGTEKFNDSLGWNRIQGGDGGFVRVDQSNPLTVYHTFTGASPERSDDGGVTWVDKSSGITNPGKANFYAPYVMDPSNSSRLIFGTDVVSLTTNRMDTWSAKSQTFNSSIDALAIAKSNGNTMYAALGSGKVFQTTDGGATNWTDLSIPGSGSVRDIQVDPVDDQIAYVAIAEFTGSSAGHVREYNRGVWSDISGDLPDVPVNSLAVIRVAGVTTLVAGTDIGVYGSTNGGLNWFVFQTGLPFTQVVSLEYSPNRNILAAGTHGRGLWEILFANPTVSIARVTDGVEKRTPIDGKFRVTLTRANPTDTVVNYTIGGTAKNGKDYKTLGGAVTILASQGTADIDVQVLDDLILEGTESVIATLTGFGAHDPAITLDTTPSKLTATVNITEVNETPTNLLLSQTAVREQTGTANPLAAPLTVGDITIIDDELGTNVLSVSGTDAASFQIVGNQLQFTSGTTLDFETKKQYAVDVTSTDGAFVLTKSFTVSLTDVNEVPTDITLSNNTLPENSNTANPLLIGTLTITDDALGTNTLSVAAGADGSKFQITGNQLQFRVGTLLDFETQPTLTVNVTSTDTNGPNGPVLTFTKPLIIQLTDVNEAAVAITLTPNTIPENTATPVDVGTVAVINDALGTSALVPTIGGPDAASFTLVGNTLRFKSGVTLDRETKDTYLVDFTAVDTGNTSIQDVKRVTVTITNVNETPTGVNDYITLAEGGTATSLVGGAASVLTNDLDPDLLGNLDTLTVSANTSPAHGLLTINSDGTFTYKHDDSENFTDSFTYTVRDVGGLTSIATVNIQITPVNDNVPIAVTDPVTVLEGGTVSIVNGGAVSLLANDIDLDLPYDTLTFDTNPVTNVIHGTLLLNPNGSFQYTHDGSETTSDSFQYHIHDALNRDSIGTVNIRIIPVNDNPISRPDTIEVSEGGTATLLLNGASSVLDNDSDAESPNSALSTTVSVPPQHGSLSLNLNGTFSYVNDGNEFQSDSFVYKVTDPQGGFSQATVTIRIIPVNDSTPVAVNDYAEVSQGGSILSLIGGSVAVASNDTDADLPFDALTVTQMSSPMHGSLLLAPDGSFRYTHDGSKTSSDSFTYKLTDAVGHVSNTATVNIAVRLINERPIANAGGPYVIAPGTDLALIGAASVDPDGDPLTYLWDIKGDGIIDATTASPIIPWTTLVSLGVISGVTSVRLEVRDPSGLSSSSSTNLQITGPYRFTAVTDGVADNYVVSTINGAVDIRKAGTLTNLAASGLTVVTEVVIVGSSDDETFLVQSPSRTMSFMIDGNLGTDIVKVQGTALADTFNVSSTPAGRIIIAKATGTPFYVSATSDYMVVLGSDGADTLDAHLVTAALTGLQLNGENGNDTLTGGLGNDAFVGGDGTDLLAEVGPGNVMLTSDTQMIGHGTDSIATDIEAIRLTGDAGNNLLDASGFTRFGVLLDGGAGDDTLRGTSKTDSLIGGDGYDEVRQAVSGNATLSNTLLVLGTAPNTVADGLSSIEKVRLTGNETANKMDASNFSGSATLDGGTGNDTLIGGSGNDLIIGGPDTIAIGVTDNDSLMGNGGNDTIKGGAGADFIDGGDGNDGLAGGDGNDTMKGGNGNDTILGQGGNDSLRGGAGRDLIQGGLGKDNIDGEGDIDTVMGGSGGGPDSGDKIFDPFGEVIENFRFTVEWLNLI